MVAVYTLFDLVSSCPIFFIINFEQEEQVYYERFLSFSAFCKVNIVKTSWIWLSDFKVEATLSIQHP